MIEIAAFSKSEKEVSLEALEFSKAEKIQAFHKSFPMYEETPLAKLQEYAKVVGVKSVYVKDESYRFGLNAFKVLGGSYAIGKYIANQPVDIRDIHRTDQCSMIRHSKIHQFLIRTKCHVLTDFQCCPDCLYILSVIPAALWQYLSHLLRFKVCIQHCQF